MKKTIFLSAAALAMTLSAGAAEEARLLRFPATNGSEIVFTCAGDLYKVPIAGGEASRLTSHVGYEMFPRFSPDGATIAFTGQYDGNTEVFTMPSHGGEPLRVTYTATNGRDDLGDRMGPNNIVLTWTPDGKQIVYRNRISDGFSGRLNKVDREGGLSEQIPLPEGGFCSFSADGKQMAYNRVMREFRTWKYYKGGMADDVWVYNPEAGTVENITNNPAQDIIPMWIGDEIFFCSDRDRTMNIFAYNTKTKQTSKVTNFTEYDVKFPSSHGSTIVFENGGYIYKLDAATRSAEKVNITLTSDNIYARTALRYGGSYVTAASLSPAGERVAITARGEVFDVPAEKGVTRNITRTPGAHERDAQWSPDGKWIAYISDRSGETEIYMQPVEGGEPVRLSSGTDTYISDFKISADASKIVYTDRKNRIKLIDVENKKVSTLGENPMGGVVGVTFSPDGEWLTYARNTENNIHRVFLYNLAQGTEHAVTDKWYDSYDAIFSADGKYLVFTSGRDFNPTYGWKEWNHVYGNMNGVYLLMLSKDTPSPFIETDDKVAPVLEEGPKAESKKDAKGSKDKAAASESTSMKVDLEGIMDRIVKLPVAASNYSIVYADGDRVYYYTKGKTKVYDLREQEETEVADAMMFVEPGSKKAGFFRGESVFVTDIPSGAASLDEEVNLSHVTINVDYSAEWAQIFDEVWRAFRDGFYVENMHGVDWTAMKKKYEVLVPHIKNRLDLNYVIGELIGELSVGHAYVGTGEMERPVKLETGLLGAEISRDRSGFFRIEKILRGASWNSKLRSPLTEQGVDVKQGEYIVAIDGVSTAGVKDMYSLLVGKAGIPTEISVNTKPQASGARKVVIRPIHDEYPLYHYEWVQNNIARVDKATGGRVGYIYIPDMGPEGLNEFSRHFYPQLDKEALIIDDRANGGGNVSPMILERLSREAYRVTMRRSSSLTGTIPDATLVGPKVCLINKYSASDGDLFPWGFRALGLGKLIGMRTWGGIVGISSSLPFMDGTDIRVPFMTSYDPKTGDWIIENHGVDPDIVVDNDPIKEYNGEDQQLDRAIEEILKELNDRKPLPGVPAPRVWNK